MTTTPLAYTSYYLASRFSATRSTLLAAMLDMRVNTLLRLLALGFYAYYVHHIAAPNVLYLYQRSSNLWNIRCGCTWLSWLSSNSFAAPGRLFETACCIGSNCVAVAKMRNDLARYRVARSVDHYIDYWFDTEHYRFLNLGRSEVCHLTLAHGTWELDISRAHFPTLHGLAMLFLFSYALRHAMAQEKVTVEVTRPTHEQQQVRSPIEVMGLRDSKVSDEVAQDLKKLFQATNGEHETSDENDSSPGPDAGSDKLGAYNESLPQITAELVPKRVRPRPRKA